MKILLFTEIFDCGGVDTFVVNLINDWPVSEDSFIIVANKNYPGLKLIEERVRRSLTVIRHNTVIYANIGLERQWLYRYKRFLSPLLRYVVLAWNVFAFRSLMKRVRADRCMVINGGYPGGDSCRAAAIAWGILKGPRSGIHNFHNLAQTSAWHSKLQDALVDRLVERYSEVFVTVSDAAACSMSARPQIARSGRVTYIHNGYAGATVDVNEPATFRDEIGVSTGTPLCLMLGTYEPRKGHAFLLDAWGLVLQSVPSARLAICGFGTSNEVRAVQQLVQERALAKSVLLMDFRRDLENMLRSIDVLLVSSQGFESFGYTSVEAMAHRVPIVATDVGGIPEVVVSGEGGFCLPKADISGYAATIVRLLQDPELRKAQGARGGARYQALFSSKIMARRYADILHPNVKPVGERS